LDCMMGSEVMDASMVVIDDYKNTSKWDTLLRKPNKS